MKPKAFILSTIFMALSALFSTSCGGPEHSVGENRIASLGEYSEQAFEMTLFPVLRTHCKDCHGQGQVPEFAVSDVIAAHDEVLGNGLVNFRSPGRSRLVQKIRGGHNSISSLVADDIQDQVAEWLALSNK